MTQYPNTFTEQLQPLPQDLGEEPNKARERLAEKGFVVLSGLTRFMAGAVSSTAAQPHIVEFCPKDPTDKRFGTEESTEQWLGKGGGRGMFLLAKNLGNSGIRLAGYGWTGLESSDQIDQGKTTFAVRIGAEGRGNKAGADFSKLIVAGSAAVHGAQDVWLETWKSNGNAVDAYAQVGFEYVTEKDDIRPTLHPVGSIIHGRQVFLGEKDGQDMPMVEDTRVYMAYPNERLL